MSRGVRRFEDLIAWQKARTFARDIFLMSRSSSVKQDRALASQLTRAARSVMANIAEGFDRTGPREFHKALSTSKGSCGEVRSDLYLLLDVGFIDQRAFDRLQGQGEELSRVIAGLMLAVRKSIERAARPSSASR